jgi:hypothetical protein
MGVVALVLLGSTCARSLPGWKRYAVMFLRSSGHGTVG